MSMKANEINNILMHIWLLGGCLVKLIKNALKKLLAILNQKGEP